MEEYQQNGQNVRKHTPVSFKMLKELKFAFDSFGPTYSPYTMTLLQSLDAMIFAPADWKRACLEHVFLGEITWYESQNFLINAAELLDLMPRELMPAGLLMCWQGKGHMKTS